jgi:hypothetical protein
MTENKVDNLGKRCEKCKRGKYVEKDLLEGLEGVLRCDACDEKIDRREQLVEGFDRFLQGVCEEEERKRTKKHLNEDNFGRKMIKLYGELPQNRIFIRGGK